ncbi:MAG: WYL domain-containing protein [Micropepsaceae bacterium]
MRASRLLSIQLLLQLRGRLSAEALAETFEVSVRTIHRDIDQLSAAGIPVYAERGRNGGFRLMEGYRARLTGLTGAEAGALAFAGAPKAAADLGLKADLAAAELKLRAALAPDIAARADSAAARFYLDPAPWYGDEGDLRLLPALADAVWGERRLRLVYDSWKARVTREADALGLVMKGGAWYLVAGVEGQPRSYRVSNIQDMALIEGRAKRPRGFALGAWWAQQTREFETRLFSGRAHIRISREGRRLLTDLNPRAAAAMRATAKALPGGWTEAAIPVEGPVMAARQLLQLGTEVEVLGPGQLRDAITRQAAAVAALYRKTR